MDPEVVLAIINIVLAGMFGAVIGSFTNVCKYRESLIENGDICRLGRKLDEKQCVGVDVGCSVDRSALKEFSDRVRVNIQSNRYESTGLHKLTEVICNILRDSSSTYFVLLLLCLFV